ncbi:MAG: DinB family protein [Bacteroidota bacterium]|nr:DinB family protein [Bacteroidota bacterium]
MSQPQISLFTWMLEDVRKETLEGVKHLTKEQLMQSPIENEYPIGTYLMHLAETDIDWLEDLSGIEQPEVLKKKCFYMKWFARLKTSELPSEMVEIEDYLSVMSEARKNFLDFVLAMYDEQLEEFVFDRRSGKTIQWQKKWIIYHLLEHEAHHRGQMFMLIRKAGLNKK